MSVWRDREGETGQGRTVSLVPATFPIMDVAVRAGVTSQVIPSSFLTPQTGNRDPETLSPWPKVGRLVGDREEWSPGLFFLLFSLLCFVFQLSPLFPRFFFSFENF